MIGGSIALRARATGDRVIGFDPDPAAAAYALGHGIVDETVPRLDDLLTRGETLVVAAPLEATIEILERRAAAGGTADLILDVASVKAPLVPFVGRLRGFVPTHPLAGAERSGPAAARADLFADRPWAFVPTADAPLDARAAAFITRMGARPIALAAAEHDRVVALTSHVPQLLSTVLASSLCAEDDALIAQLHGPGLESMLRLARSGWPMWSSIIAANGPPVAAYLRKLAASIEDVALHVERCDSAALEVLFDRANAFAAGLDSGPRENA